MVRGIWREHRKGGDQSEAYLTGAGGTTYQPRGLWMGFRS